MFKKMFTFQKVIFCNSYYMAAFEQELSKESGYSACSSGFVIVLLLLRMMYVLNTCLRQNKLTYCLIYFAAISVFGMDEFYNQL